MKTRIKTGKVSLIVFMAVMAVCVAGVAIWCYAVGYQVKEPSQTALRSHDDRGEEQARKERIEQQDGQHGVVRQRPLFGHVVEAQQGGRGKGKSQPHDSFTVLGSDYVTGRSSAGNPTEKAGRR